jgi:antitoxin VapB
MLHLFHVDPVIVGMRAYPLDPDDALFRNPWVCGANRGKVCVMINISQEIEALVQAKSARTGRTPDEILREALSRKGDVLPRRNSAMTPSADLTKDELIAGMEAIAARSAARPVADPRSINEIIGYDDFGLPR